MKSERFLCRLRRGLGLPATPSRCLLLDICCNVKARNEEQIWVFFIFLVTVKIKWFTPGLRVVFTCFSCSSELTLTLHISQWKVRSWEFGSPETSPPCSGLGLGPNRGYTLMGPSPLWASRIVLCLVPGNNTNIGVKFACKFKHRVVDMSCNFTNYCGHWTTAFHQVTLK